MTTTWTEGDTCEVDPSQPVLPGINWQEYK